MNKRKIGLLENITVARGASPNEEAIAKAKIAKYAAAMNKPKQRPKTEPLRFMNEDEAHSFDEQQFRQKWYELRQANRKRWKVE